MRWRTVVFGLVNDVNPLAVVLAALSTFVIGGLWYSVLFAEPWQRAAGVGDDQLQRGAARIFGGAAVLALVMAAVLAPFVGTAGVGFGAAAGAAVAVWILGAVGTLYLFERRPLRLFLIDGGYFAVAFPVMGAIVGALQ